MKQLKAYIRNAAGFSPDARLFLLVTFFSSLSISTFTLVFNLYVASMGYSAHALGELESVAAATTALFLLPLGYLSSRISYRTALILSCSILAASFLGLSFVTQKSLLIGLRAMSAIGVSFSLVIAWPFMSDNSSAEERPYLFSLHFFFFTLSNLCGSFVSGHIAHNLSPLLGLLPDTPSSYRLPILAAAAMASAGIIPAMLITNSPGKKKQRGFAFNEIINRNTIKIMIPPAVIAYGAGMIIPFVNIFLKGRFGAVSAVVLVQSLSLPFLLMMGFSGSLYVCLAGFWMRTALMNASTPIYSMFLMEQAGKNRRILLSAVYGVLWNFFWSLGAGESGKLQAVRGFDLPFVITFATYAAATVLISGWFGTNSATKPAAAVFPGDAEEPA